MIQSQAREAIAQLRADIIATGYDQADKRRLAALFGDLKYHHYLPDKQRYVDHAGAKRIADLELKWMKDRRNPSGGADTIEAILRELEGYIPRLPTEIVSGVIIHKTQAQLLADEVQAILQQRGVAANPQAAS